MATYCLIGCLSMDALSMPQMVIQYYNVLQTMGWDPLGMSQANHCNVLVLLDLMFAWYATAFGKQYRAILLLCKCF